MTKIEVKEKKNILDKIKIVKDRMDRIELDRVFDYSEYNKTFSYGQTHADVKGVKKEIDDLNSAKLFYNDELSRTMDSRREDEIVAYSNYKRTHDSLNRFVVLEVIALILNILGNFLNKIYMANVLSSNGVSFLMKLMRRFIGIILPVSSFYLYFLGWILILIFFFNRNSCIKKYNKLRNQVSLNIKNYTDAFISTCKKIYNNIDELYLQSLSIADRYAILSYRSQQAHYAEESAKTQRMLESQLRTEQNSQRALEEQQKQARDIRRQTEIAEEQEADRKYDRRMRGL